ncbi:hypothetical protein TWF481_011633 [Arthrobotrys musiformis]|uniref:BTB domain-containing protein n=1 Tax=Arthrobotrys musiformis TaxID=47236 RepID=A0AAV9VZ42_9PEZI
MSSPPNCEDVYADGDVLVTFDVEVEEYLDEEDDDTEQGEKSLRVSSVILSMVSPVFKSMLDPSKHWRESQPSKDSNGMKEIVLMAETFEIGRAIMKMIHHRSGEMHHSSCVTLKSKGSNTWIAPSRFSGDHLHDSIVCPWFLWIGKVFNVSRILQECGCKVLLNCSKLADGTDNYVVSGSHLHPLLDKYMSVIWEFRENFLNYIIERLDQQTYRFHTADVGKIPICTAGPRMLPTVDCDKSQTAALKRVSTTLGRPDASFNDMSLARVLSVLKDEYSIDSSAIGDYKNGHRGMHKGCRVMTEFREMVETIELLEYRKELLLALSGKQYRGSVANLKRYIMKRRERERRKAAPKR